MVDASQIDDWVTPASATVSAPAAPAPAAKASPPINDWQTIDDWQEPQGHFGEWGKAFTDIPSEIGKQYSSAWQGVKEGLGPSGKGAEGPLAGTLKTGAGLLNAAYLGSGIGPAVVGTARSLIGHPMAEAEHAIGSTIAPQIAAQDNPEEMYQTAAGNAETALGAMGRVPGAPAPSLVPSPVRRAITPFPTAPERLAARDIWRNATGEDPTAGAVTGRPVIQRTESTLGDAPMAFSAYSKAMRRNNEGFSRFVANSFGETNSLVDSDALQSARDRLGARFESASQGMEIAHDKRLGGDLAKIASDLGNEGLSDPEVKRVTQMLTNVQNGFVTKNKGPSLMDGEAYQTLTRKDTPLDRATSDPNPNISYYATRVRSALDDAMERTVDTAVKNAFSKGKQGGPAQARAMQLAQAQEDLKDARRQWFNMKAAEGAADEEGIVTPQRLRRALTNTQDRKTMYALSRGDLAPVARAGVTLFRGLPDSGTAQRSLITTLAAALPGAFLWGEPVSGMAATAAAPGLVGRAMLSRPIQAYLKNQLLSDRAAVPAAPTPTPATSLITSPGRSIAPWQQPSITPNAAQQIRRRFPWLATGEIPHFADEQQRARGGRVNPANIDHNPTEAQKKSGNYAKDHVSIHGLDITIENAKGKMRRGVDKGGKPWAVKMPAHYGYIRKSEGADGDHVDCYLGPHLQSPHVFVVDQLNADTGKFDEHKCFLGFGSKAQATRAYHAAFSDGKSHERLGNISEMPIDKFKDWLARGDTTKPLAA